MFAHAPPDAPMRTKRSRVEEDNDTAMITSQESQKLLNAVARQALLHEQSRQEFARTDNRVLKANVNTQFSRDMEHTINQYEETGKQARTNPDFAGHPEGKKPDAFGRALIVRVSQQLNTPAVQEALTKLEPETQQKLVPVVQRWHALAQTLQTDGANFKTVRCFRVLVDDKKGTKWIIYTKHANVMADIEILGQCKVLEAAGIQITDDHAPASSVSIEIHDLLIKMGVFKGKTKGKGRKGGA